MTLTWITAALLAGVLIGIILLARSHHRWLLMQSPAGSWLTCHNSQKITLVFEGGPNEGMYKQLSESQGGAAREFGNWASKGSRLNLLILATDQRNHPRFGIDTTYSIRYVAPNKIVIDGPDRPRLTYERAPAGTRLNFDPDKIA